MEEVDGIIIHTLKSIGCEVEDGVESLHQFSTETIVEATVKCLRVINGGSDLPSSLPPGMSARFRVGTGLAQAMQDLGYQGDVGYQTFLYSSESDIRKVFMFLVEKLPREAEEAEEESIGASVLLQRAISAEISRRLNGPWTPSYCKKNGVCWRGKPPALIREGFSSSHCFHANHLTWPEGVGDLTKKIPKEIKAYYTKDLPVITSQTHHLYDVAPSLLEKNSCEVAAQQEWENEWNQSGLPSRLSEEEYRARKRQRLQKKIADQLRQGLQKSEGAAAATQDLMQMLNSMGDRAGAVKTKGSRFTHTEKLQFAQDADKVAAQIGVGEGPKVDTEEEMQQKREAEVQKLKEDLDVVTSKLEKMDLDMKKFTANMQQMEEQISQQKEKNKDKEEAYKVKKRTIDLLPDAENNIEKLQAVLDGSAQRLVNLATQWEKHRAPLIDQYRELKELNENRVSEAQKKLEEIKLLREKMKEVAEETRNKEELHRQLVSEYDRMTKDVNRSAYTRRIMEIVANIKKQKEDIEKILIDTRAIQKEINQLTGKLDRTFTVTDELIFKDAKKDEAVRKAYKYLAALHENCDLLIQTVEETGGIMREIRDLEDQIEQESNKKILSNLEKIQEDYNQMKKENATLMAKLKGK